MGTPRNADIGTWPSGNPTEAGWSCSRVEPDRTALVQDRTQHAVTAGKVRQHGDLAGGHPGVHQSSDPLAVGEQRGAVAGAGGEPGEVDHPLQDRVLVAFGGDRDE
jgi:hypothetical protein